MSDTPSITDVKPDGTAPTEQPDLESQTDAQASAKHPQPVPSTSQQPEAPPSVGEIKYLIVDDNKVNRKLFTVQMAKLGLDQHYHMATNGQEAIDAYKKNPQHCRLILMDTSMPVKSGMAATQEIREYERENDIKPAVILALTANIWPRDRVGQETERYKREFGMDGLLQKPVRMDDLKAAIEAWSV